MTQLEESAFRISGGKLQLSKLGTAGKDYSSLENKIDPRVEKLMKEWNEEYKSQVSEDKFSEHFVHNVALPFYNTHFKVILLTFLNNILEKSQSQSNRIPNHRRLSLLFILQYIKEK